LGIMRYAVHDNRVPVLGSALPKAPKVLPAPNPEADGIDGGERAEPLRQPVRLNDCLARARRLTGSSAGERGLALRPAAEQVHKCVLEPRWGRGHLGPAVPERRPARPPRPRPCPPPAPPPPPPAAPRGAAASTPRRLPAPRTRTVRPFTRSVNSRGGPS